jgi:Rps23 Pro-64 3,4-dihydroxylase Tpa1-like proline 4-hydroxylase
MNKEEIISIHNFVDPNDAQSIIDLMEELKEKNQLSNERGDSTYRLYSSYHQTALNFVKKYSEKYIDGQKLYVSDYLIALYEKNAFMDVHVDVLDDSEVVSTVLYLNDEYTGGELFFPEIDGGYLYTPQKYECVSFPTPYPHGVNPVISGKRYIITISYSDKIEYKKY